MNELGQAIAATLNKVEEIKAMNNARLNGLALRLKGEAWGMIQALRYMGKDFRWTNTERSAWAIVPRD